MTAATAHTQLTWKPYGIPAPEAEHRFHPMRRWRLDYYWPEYNLALEVEGGAWTGGRHTRGKGFIGDIEKYNEAAISGITVLRCTPQQLRTGEAQAWIKRFMTEEEES